MLLIIEGIDGAGKSTLAERLQRATLNARIIHRGPPKKHPLKEYVRPLKRYRPGSGKTIICDRWHIGELIYPYIFERRTRYTDAIHHEVEDFLLSQGAVLIACAAKPATAQVRVTDRGEVTPKLKMLQAAQRQFDHAFRYRTRLPLIAFSIEKPVDLRDVIMQARHCEEEAMRCAQL